MFGVTGISNWDNSRQASSKPAVCLATIFLFLKIRVFQTDISIGTDGRQIDKDPDALEAMLKKTAAANAGSVGSNAGSHFGDG